MKATTIIKDNSKKNDVKITFGLIMLNGAPFIKYNLRALYPFAHQIIAVEGAAPSSKYTASEDGHSKDHTLDILRAFKIEEDPENKIVIVTAEDEGQPNGFWAEKDQMSQAYAKRATGNYLWQIDVDEFYLEKDMQTIVNMLCNDPEIKAVSFSMKTFWGAPGYQVNGFFLEKFIVHRIFAWGPGYEYITHRPPTVKDDKSRQLRLLKWITPGDMKRKGIYLYHYELMFPKQVIEKCSYYAGAEWTTSLKKANEWVHDCYLNLSKPFRVHMTYDHLSWLERFKGEQPFQITQMFQAVISGEHDGIGFRNTEDAEILLSKRSYLFRRAILKWLIPFDKGFNILKIEVKQTLIGKVLLQVKRKIIYK